MNVAKVLVGLTPRAKQIDGMGFGGTPLLSIDDRIALLAGLKCPALDWAYYRYCGHEAKLLPVLRYLQMSIDIYCGINRIKIKRETRAGIINVAISEYMSPVCTECDGAGLVKKHAYSAEVVCEKCHGAGRRRMSLREISNNCSISHKSWTSSHDAVINEAFRLISALDRDVINNAFINTSDELSCTDVFNLKQA